MNKVDKFSKIVLVMSKGRTKDCVVTFQGRLGGHCDDNIGTTLGCANMADAFPKANAWTLLQLGVPTSRSIPDSPNHSRNCPKSSLQSAAI